MTTIEITPEHKARQEALGVVPWWTIIDAGLTVYEREAQGWKNVAVRQAHYVGKDGVLYKTQREAMDTYGYSIDEWTPSWIPRENKERSAVQYILESVDSDPIAAIGRSNQMKRMRPKQAIAEEKKLRGEIRKIEKQINEIYENVDDSFPRSVRPAKSSDIKLGQILWYKEGDFDPFWKVVCEVLRPNDFFKAYVAEDGCRYGLDDAYVEVEENDTWVLKMPERIREMSDGR